MSSWELLMQTCWWSLSDHWSVHLTPPHLPGFVWSESSLELSALWQPGGAKQSHISLSRIAKQTYPHAARSRATYCDQAGQNRATYCHQGEQNRLTRIYPAPEPHTATRQGKTDFSAFFSAAISSAVARLDISFPNSLCIVAIFSMSCSWNKPRNTWK